MATQVPEDTYPPATYGPFTLASGPQSKVLKVTFTMTSGGVLVWPPGTCVRFIAERRVQGNTWVASGDVWELGGGGGAFDRNGQLRTATARFTKPEGVDMRIFVVVLQTITTAITIEDL